MTEKLSQNPDFGTPIRAMAARNPGFVRALKKRGRYQCSVRSLFAWVAACAFAIVFPHVAVFMASLVCVIVASRATYSSVRSGRPRFGLVFAFIAAWTVFYFLSIGPFIAVSEFERKVFDRYYIGQFGKVYLPVLTVSALPRRLAKPLLWYAKEWIPPYATGVPVTTQGDGLSNQISIAPLIGTWKNEKGTVFHFRADGTGRYRFSSERQVRYLEWTLNSNEFAIYVYSSRYSDNPVAWFARRVMMDDTPTDRYRVAEMGPTQFRLRHASGRTSVFTAAQDTALELAP